MEFIIFLSLCLLAVILLNVAAYFWGADSREDLNSREWDLRQLWPGFH
jgi:hypothetical protein